jgi:diacylglycerol kinase family enzyme
MQHLLLVANPAASGFTATLHRSVVAALRSRFEVTPIWPNGPEEAEAEAARAAAAGVDVVAAMGGDGIVHRVANGVVGTRACLAVIPAGTSNVFARLTGHPRRGVAAAVALAESRSVRSLATARITAAGAPDRLDRVALFAAGVGYDADVIHDSDRRPLRKVGAGTIHYARSAVRVAFTAYRRHRPDLTVAVDGTTSRAVTVIAQVHDHFSYLGRRPLTISPQGGPAAIAIRRATPLRLARVLTAAARQRDPGAVTGVRVWQPFQHLTVTADGGVGFEADGEYWGTITSLTLTMVPDSLLLVDPRHPRR